MVKDSGRERNSEILQKYLQYSSIGFEFVSSVVIGLAIGYFADMKFETKPIGVLIGSLVGVGLGLYSFIRNAMKLDKKLSSKYKGKNSKTDEDK